MMSFDESDKAFMLHGWKDWQSVEDSDEAKKHVVHDGGYVCMYV
jgi:hypothetical protein